LDSFPKNPAVEDAEIAENAAAERRFQAAQDEKEREEAFEAEQEARRTD
jgi:hypothetical protein